MITECQTGLPNQAVERTPDERAVSMPERWVRRLSPNRSASLCTSTHRNTGPMALNTNKRSAICVFVTTILVALLAQLTVAAQIVSFEFRGTVTSWEDPTSFLAGGVPVGAELMGLVTFNVSDARSDLFPDDPGFALYTFPFAAPFVLTITAGVHTLTGRHGLVAVMDTASDGRGRDGIQYGASIGDFDGEALAPTFTTSGINISLHRTTSPLNVLGNDELPTTAPILSDYDYGAISISASDATRGISFLVYGAVSEITTVPEPNASVLLFVGFAALMIMHQRRSGITLAASPCEAESRPPELPANPHDRSESSSDQRCSLRRSIEEHCDASGHMVMDRLLDIRGVQSATCVRSWPNQSCERTPDERASRDLGRRVRRLSTGRSV